MPINSEKMKLYAGGSIYSKEWKAIRERILERAKNKCEGSPSYPECSVENYSKHPITGSKVILTIAHLDHDPSNNNDDNLKAWCQKCHNTYDAPHRALNRKNNQSKK